MSSISHESKGLEKNPELKVGQLVHRMREEGKEGKLIPLHISMIPKVVWMETPICSSLSSSPSLPPIFQYQSLFMDSKNNILYVLGKFRGLIPFHLGQELNSPTIAYFLGKMSVGCASKWLWISKLDFGTEILMNNARLVLAGPRILYLALAMDSKVHIGQYQTTNGRPLKWIHINNLDTNNFCMTSDPTAEALYFGGNFLNGTMCVAKLNGKMDWEWTSHNVSCTINGLTWQTPNHLYIIGSTNGISADITSKGQLKISGDEKGGEKGGGKYASLILGHINTSGRWIWVRLSTPKNVHVIGESITVESETGYLYVTGMERGTPDTSCYCLIGKYNPQCGELLWTRKIHMDYLPVIPRTTYSTIIHDGTPGINYVQLWYQGNLILGTGECKLIPGAGETCSCFLGQINGSGQWDWELSLDHLSGFLGQNITSDGHGNIYLVGNINSSRIGHSTLFHLQKQLPELIGVVRTRKEGTRKEGEEWEADFKGPCRVYQDLIPGMEYYLDHNGRILSHLRAEQKRYFRLFGVGVYSDVLLLK